MTSSAFAELKENADINVYVCRNRWFEAVYGLRPIMGEDFYFERRN